MPSHYRKNTIGYTEQDNEFYVYVGVGPMYIRTELQFKIFNSVNALSCYSNLKPMDQTPTDVTFDVSLYRGSVANKNTIIVHSPLPFNTCFGQYLSTASSIAVVNLDAMTIATETKTYSVNIINEEVLLRYESPATNYCFPYFHNAITLCNFDVNKESLNHPFILYKYLAMYFRNSDNRNSTYPYDWDGSTLLSVPSRISMPRPKLLFSGDRGATWYRYNVNTSAFVQVVPASTYISNIELRDNGNLFEEYQQIPPAAFVSKFGVMSDRLKVMTNGFVFSKSITHKFWLDTLDVQQYLRFITHTNKKTIVSGTL